MNDNRSNEQDDLRVPDSVLHDCVDGELDTPATTELEAALGRDPDLRKRLNDLRGLLQALSELPEEASPPQAVWSGIQERISDPETRPTETAATETTDIGHRSHRRMSLSWPQLVAAVLALVVGTSTVTWALSNGLPVDPQTGSMMDRTAGAGTTGAEPRAMLGSVQTISDGRVVPNPGDSAPLDEVDLFSQYEQTATELQELVNEGQGLLDPETVEIIRNSLEAIDLALFEARQALEDDPGSEALNRLLLRAMRKKVDLLRGTASAIQSVA